MGHIMDATQAEITAAFQKDYSPVGAKGIYRPANWAKTPKVYITSSVQGTTVSPTTGETVVVLAAQTSYVFDSVLTLEHDQSLEKTRHPVQTGADISSHAYLLCARLSMQIVMSDAVGQYATTASASSGPCFTVWSGSTSKSISAYQTLLNLQSQRVLLTITTRLRTYTNMLITRLPPIEDYRTVAGLRMRVDFEQIFTAAFAANPVSARANDTQSTGVGSMLVTTLPGSTANQYGVPLQAAQSSAYAEDDNLLGYLANGNEVNVPGAGAYSSSPTSSLANLGAPQ